MTSSEPHIPQVPITINADESELSAGCRDREAIKGTTCHSFDYFTANESGGERLTRISSWLVILVASIVVGLVKGAVAWGTRLLQNIRLDQMALLSDRTGAVFASMGVMSSYTVISGLVSCLLVMHLSRAGGGGGIPDIKAYLNGNLLPDFLSWQTFIVRAVGVCLTASCGVMAGPEGPIAHVGMILTTLIPSLIFGSKKMNDRDRFDLATMGSGIGIASAFTAPLAGTLFALEEAASFWHPELISRTLVGAAVAAVVGEYTSAGFECEKGQVFCVSVWGEFSFTLETFLRTFYRAWEIPLFLIEGGMIGLLAVALSYCITHNSALRKRCKFKIFDVCISFGLSAIIFCLSTLIVDCVPVNTIPIKSGSTVALSMCTESGINPVAVLLLEPPQYAIRTLFTASSSDEPFALGIIFYCLVISILGLLLMSGLTVPAGQFIPLVLTGSLAGRLLGCHLSAASPGVYAIAGAAGLLAGVSRMTVWVAVVMIESTAQIELTIPVVLSVVASKFVSDLLMPDPLYERLIAAKGIRYLPPHDDPHIERKLKDKLVRDVVSHTVFVVNEFEEIENIKTILNRTSFQIFPVINSKGNVVGIISRENLINITKHPPGDLESTIQIPRNGAVTVTETTALGKAYYLFTHLGLGMLIVTDESNRLLGVLTRDNFHSVLHR